MSYLLHIEVSPSGERSVSRGISQEFTSAWSAAPPESHIVLRDLAENAVPHLDLEAIYVGRTPEDQRTPSMAAKLKYRRELIAEITGADEIIMPGTLDTSRAQGLAGRKITFVVAQGGSYIDCLGRIRPGWNCPRNGIFRRHQGDFNRVGQVGSTQPRRIIFFARKGSRQILGGHLSL